MARTRLDPYDKNVGPSLMQCMQCGKPLTRFRRGGGEFCSDEHRDAYRETIESAGLERLRSWRGKPVHKPAEAWELTNVSGLLDDMPVVAHSASIHRDNLKPMSYEDAGPRVPSWSMALNHPMCELGLLRGFSPASQAVKSTDRAFATCSAVFSSEPAGPVLPKWGDIPGRRRLRTGLLWHALPGTPSAAPMIFRHATFALLVTPKLPTAKLRMRTCKLPAPPQTPRPLEALTSSRSRHPGCQPTPESRDVVQSASSSLAIGAAGWLAGALRRLKAFLPFEGSFPAPEPSMVAAPRLRFPKIGTEIERELSFGLKSEISVDAWGKPYAPAIAFLLESAAPQLQSELGRIPVIDDGELRVTPLARYSIKPLGAAGPSREQHAGSFAAFKPLAMLGCYRMFPKKPDLGSPKALFALAGQAVSACNQSETLWRHAREQAVFGKMTPANPRLAARACLRWNAVDCQHMVSHAPAPIPLFDTRVNGCFLPYEPGAAALPAVFDAFAGPVLRHGEPCALPQIEVQKTNVPADGMNVGTLLLTPLAGEPPYPRLGFELARRPNGARLGLLKLRASAASILDWNAPTAEPDVRPVRTISAPIQPHAWLVPMIGNTGEDPKPPVRKASIRDLLANNRVVNFGSSPRAKWKGGLALMGLLLVFGAYMALMSSRPVEADIGKADSERPLKRLQDRIGRRAGVNLADDFRTGLHSWQGAENWGDSWAYDAAGFVKTGRLALYTPSLQMADYRLEFLGQIEKKGLGWVVRAVDLKNFVAVRIVQTRSGPLPRVAMIRYTVINGKEDSPKRVTVPLEVRSDTLFHVRMEVSEARYSVFVQDRMVDSWEDARLQTGGVGFFSAKGEQGRVKWVQVTYQNDWVGRLCAVLAG